MHLIVALRNYAQWIKKTNHIDKKMKKLLCFERQKLFDKIMKLFTSSVWYCFSFKMSLIFQCMEINYYYFNFENNVNESLTSSVI